jgi:Leucine-rich repeat (LRR) protein
MKTLFTLSFFVFALCTTTIVVKAQVNETDSLALVDLYNSTNGPNWFHHDNWLTGPVKKWYGIGIDTKRVSTISLYNNNLSGTIPSSTGNLSKLRDLELHDNQLIGSIPPELGKLSNLSFFSLGNNQLSGSIPPELGKLSNLTYLYLWGNQLSGSIPPELGKLSKLLSLAFEQNQLSGSIPPELGKLSSLQYLYLYSNQLSGSIPSQLGNLSNVGDFYLDNNKLSGSIPPELGKLSNLWRLSLEYNQLSGSIPPELGNLSNLGELYLNSNQLSGSIPPELGNLSKLQELYLYSNQLSGSIPPELGNLSHLSDLQLYSNQLSGSIPPELGNLSHLKFLSLDSNQLSGSIPPELGNLSSLRKLSLNNNNLNGGIPSFGTLSLNALNLSYNQFTFEGMEELVQKFPYAIYYPQAKITVNINGNTISVPAGGTLSNNVYLWVKKGQKDVIRIFGDSTFHPTESGTYAVRIKNKIATELKLTGNIVHYTAPVTANAITSNTPTILKEGFSIYPNPVKDVLHVTTNGSASFSLISKSGKILFTTNIDNAGSINVASLAAGEYYLKNNTSNVAKKVVIVR